MTHKERIENALAMRETDRLPYGMWLHFPNEDRMPVRLAELTLRYQRELDLDFVKYMPYGMHSTIDWGSQLNLFPGFDRIPEPRNWPIQKPEDWDRITPKSGTESEYAVILESQKLFRRMRREVVPFVQTVFSPMTTAAKLASADTLIKHLRECPEKVKRGLEVITETTIEYAVAAVEQGADGIFFATQMSNRKITAKEHADFVKAYDLPVLNAVKGKSWFNMLHIHGADTWFGELLDYPVQAINWHDRDDGPAMGEARKLVKDKAFIGGLSHIKTLPKGTEDEIKAQIEDTWNRGESRGVILAPGCGALPATPLDRLLFVSKCVRETARA
ncbi:MAG: uroporphyrinogen decarboxylase [Spirochaetia bacterium]|jgi:uroporphyrinogen decarboxylase|nr:uroporphyrinogen decarboxylase [Spirochaetia bacterium]